MRYSCHSFEPVLSRRDMLRASACGFGTLALADLLKADVTRAANPLAPKAPPLPVEERFYVLR